MRRMLHAVGRKLGILRPCGTFEMSYPGDNRDGLITIGGPSYTITEKGIEGPIYPSIWEDWGWIAKAKSPPQRGETSSGLPDVEPIARDKPA
ncbi:MAG TPA: hypothetical protein VH643_35570 [Gemmataceae bacterium]